MLALFYFLFCFVLFGFLFFIFLGLDLDCGKYYTNYGGNAVVQGKVREADIDRALKNLYVVLMRVGFFDGSPQFENLGKDDVCSESHRNLAIEAVREGMVLLKNDDGILPLNPQDIQIALVGPHANVTTTMIGNYHGMCETKLTKKKTFIKTYIY